jgi:capsular polysaccharide biosynthesis protein
LLLTILLMAAYNARMIELRRLGLLARRWGGWLLLGALAGVLGAYLAGFRHPPSYMARATVEALAVSDNGRIFDDQPLAAIQAQTYLATIRGTGVLSDVIATSGMRRTPEELAQQFTVQLVPGTALIDIQAYGGDGASAAYLANLIAEVFIRRVSAERTGTLATARASLEDRLAANEAALQTALVRQAILQQQARRTPAEQMELDQLSATVAEGVLTRAGLQRDLEATSQALALNAVPARLVERATAPAEPVAVRGLLSLTMAALGGLLMAAVVRATLAYAAGTLGDADQVRAALRLPVLGSIPRNRYPRK